MVEKVDKIWMDGQLVAWDAANVHVLTHTLHYGLGAFEGIRCYKRSDGKSSIFRLKEHVDRLFATVHLMSISVAWTKEQILNACLETVRANRLEECYIRPIVFIGTGGMGVAAHRNPTRVAIAAWKWGAYLGEEAIEKGIRAKVSSFSRPGVNSLLSKGKVVGHYVNSILAKHEVMRAGYEEAILLDPQGYVCEGSGENIFLVRAGTAYTPPLGSSILGGITRDTVMVLCKQLGIPVQERLISRDELYIADEVFLCGTAAEVTPVRELDDRSIGSGARGPITKRLQELYFENVRGTEPSRPEWHTLV